MANDSTKPIAVIPSPSGLQESTPKPKRQHLQQDELVSLLYLGRLSEWKGVHHAIGALSILTEKYPQKRFHLTIAGGALFQEQDYEKSLHKLVSSAGLEDMVTFTGHLKDVSPVLDSHHILLHCSIVPEPFGQVIVQAMHAGLGVIATNAGGPREIITDGVDGLLYPPADETALAASVSRMLESDNLSKFSVAAFEKSRQYTDAVIVAEIDKTLQTFSGRPIK